MAPNDPSLWLRDESIDQLAGALAALAGEPPRIEAGPPAARPEGAARHGPLTGIPGGVWIAVPLVAGEHLSRSVLRAAGIDDADPVTLESTLEELLRQVLGGLASKLSEHLGRSVAAGALTTTPAEGTPERVWHGIRVSLGGEEAALSLAFDPELIEALRQALPPEGPRSPAEEAGTEPPLASPLERRVARSKTLELLLDVELPVRVSFGRTRLPLRDIVKLTTGSIVELNRSIAEPVEVIINNCVVARGEVVVVDGNFGIRIDHVVSKEERMRVLP